MKKIFLFTAVLTVLVGLSACGGPGGKVLVEINGDEITQGDIDFLGEINPRLKAQISNPMGQKQVLDNLVEQELLYQEAIKRGINRDETVKAKADLYRRVIIAQSLLDKALEEASKKYYDEHLDEFKKLRLSHIMIKFATADEIKKQKKGSKEKIHTEQEALKIANEAKSKIDKGEEFAKVAQEVSEDLATKSRGGDLGLVAKDDKRMDTRGFAPVIEKAFEMKVGEVSGPIKTDKGYHLITVTRGVEPEPFEEAKMQIEMKQRNDIKNELVAKLKKESTIVYPEEEKAKSEAAKKPAEKPQAEAKPEAVKPEVAAPEAKPEAAKAPTPAPAPKPEEKK